jgi:hypothetical protein
MEVLLPLAERFGLPLALLVAAVVAFYRGDLLPKRTHEAEIARLQEDLARERAETDRFLDLSVRFFEDAYASQQAARDAVRAGRAAGRAGAGADGGLGPDDPGAGGGRARRAAPPFRRGGRDA